MSLGFKRVQINATSVNGVDTSTLPSASKILRTVISGNRELEFILQRSEETRELWEPFDAEVEGNVSMLFDESKGEKKHLIQGSSELNGGPERST